MANNKKSDQNNPLIDKSPADTLANIQSMLARIKTLAAECECENTGMYTCTGNELYLRLFIMINDAIDYEIERFNRE